MVQPGFVKKLMAYGCFVEFPCGISGLAPLKFLTDEFISSPTGVYEETQTVWAKVSIICHCVRNKCLCWAHEQLTNFIKILL